MHISHTLSALLLSTLASLVAADGQCFQDMCRFGTGFDGKPVNIPCAEWSPCRKSWDTCQLFDAKHTDKAKCTVD